MNVLNHEVISLYERAYRSVVSARKAVGLPFDEELKTLRDGVHDKYEKETALGKTHKMEKTKLETGGGLGLFKEPLDVN